MKLPFPEPGRGIRLSAILDYARALGRHRGLALAVNAGALVLVSYSLAQSTWHYAQPAPAAMRAGAAATAQSEFDARALQAASLFGTFSPGASARRSAADDDALPRATLNLVLTGVAMRGAASYALIGGEGRQEAAYGIGEQIMPGVVLEAVHSDRVVIARGGTREWLPLKDLAGASASGVPAAPGVSALSAGPGGSVLDRQAVKRLLQRPDFLSQALIVPNAGGGFRVGQVQAGSLYEKLGLRVGDVIRSVNGQPINNMDEVMSLYQQLGNAAEVNVEVVRAGVAQTLQVNLR